MSKRLTTLADKSVEDADIKIRIWTRRTHSTWEHKRSRKWMRKIEAMAAQQKFKVKCDFCDNKFKTEGVMYTHRANCPHNYGTTEGTFDVEDICSRSRSFRQDWSVKRGGSLSNGVDMRNQNGSGSICCWRTGAEIQSETSGIKAGYHRAKNSTKWINTNVRSPEKSTRGRKIWRHTRQNKNTIFTSTTVVPPKKVLIPILRLT